VKTIKETVGMGIGACKEVDLDFASGEFRREFLKELTEQ
jgi:hypothetical protein